MGVAKDWPFYAVQDGRVVHASDLKWSRPEPSAYGFHVVVEHIEDGRKWHSVYAHARPDLPVRVGQSVAAGKIVGWSGNTGTSTGYHLHFSILIDQQIGCHPQLTYGWFIDPEYAMDAPAPGTTPPTGKVYQTSTFMIADPKAFVVVDRGVEGGENIYTLYRDGYFVRVKNHEQGEWYSSDGLQRIRDTSPAPDTQGNERLYLQYTNGQSGGQIAPSSCQIGVTYRYRSDVQFKRKSDCALLAENSGNAESTFTLTAVHDDYTFSNGFTVDRLFITVQTGETQLYAWKDGLVMGWCGGGAEQSNNEWGGMPSELYWDRQIPQDEPNQYCS